MRRNLYSRREFLDTVSRAGSLALLATGSTRAVAAPKAKSPNVLIIQPDQHRGTVMGCAGDTDAITPHLDEFATSGARFTNCASASPVCSPFRGSFQTGLYPHRHGVVINNIRMAPELRTFAEVFAEAGYATGYIGKWHLDGGWPKVEGGKGVKPKSVGGFVPPARRQGWQEWQGYEKSHEFFEVWQYDPEGRKERVAEYNWEPTWQTDVALAFARRHSQTGRPWLYYVAYGPPHLPKQCPQRFLDMYDPASFTLPPDVRKRLPKSREAELRTDLKMYYAQVTAVDHEVGRLMAGLGKLGVAENTIVLYTSDHGDYLGSKAGANGRLRGKGTPKAAAFRIPLLVKWPGKVPSRHVSNELVSSVDLAPTVLALAGLPVPGDMQGHSKAEWCRGRTGHHSEAVYLQIGSNTPVPPEAIRPSRRQHAPPGMRLIHRKPLPAGPALGAEAKLMERSGNWDCTYDETLDVVLQPGRHRVMAEAAGRGRIEVTYTLHDYVDRMPRFQIPTNKALVFKPTGENEFHVRSDGTTTNAEGLRPHLYASGERHNPPTFVLDCRAKAILRVHAAKSVGDKSNELRVYVSEGSGPRGTVRTEAAATKTMGWWRAVWDGRFVYRPGGKGWLFDHAKDPHEIVNALNDPAYENDLKRLRRLLLAFARETGDPVLEDLEKMVGTELGK
ncbi:MAG: sulfatase [Lentisphaerae bacterium]|jgi:arylsulfatase A-like enzyme|nr:sulfatase [Lentisphaerota bacterium]MBT4821556.1 sulfatase [Lentisphaerota bacterium]MBT5604546.1 sulfatase [Lentisphaerota bacterium]MBT7061719.1 sulfatase [Lentisphaerota bacterium]MBT7848823.1 sulfatase [Lentisphaerota bacterium]